jgi:hypothetical protein
MIDLKDLQQMIVAARIAKRAVALDTAPLRVKQTKTRTDTRKYAQTFLPDFSLIFSRIFSFAGVHALARKSIGGAGIAREQSGSYILSVGHRDRKHRDKRSKQNRAR